MKCPNSLSRPRLSRATGKRSCPTRQAALTLVEIVCVMAVLALLASLVCTAVLHGKRASAKVTCISNLKQIYKALTLYREESGDFPPNSIPPHDGQLLITWEQILARKYSLDSRLFFCPANARGQANFWYGYRSYIYHFAEAGRKTPEDTSGISLIGCSNHGPDLYLGCYFDGSVRTVNLATLRQARARNHQ